MCSSRGHLCFMGVLPAPNISTPHSSFFPSSVSSRPVRRRPASDRFCGLTSERRQDRGCQKYGALGLVAQIGDCVPPVKEGPEREELLRRFSGSGDNLWCRTRASGPPPAADRPEFGLGEKQDTVATLSRDAADKSFDTVLQELTAIQKDGPRNVAILGTRYASYLHQQIIELLTYANVLVGNHVFTSGAGGTNAAVIRGALRAEKPDLLTVVLPQSLGRQPPDTQEQLKKVGHLVEMKQNDELPLDVASQLCNSDILSRCTHFIAFAFHDSDVVLEAVRQAKQLRMITTVMFLD